MNKAMKTSKEEAEEKRVVNTGPHDGNKDQLVDFKNSMEDLLPWRVAKATSLVMVDSEVFDSDSRAVAGVGDGILLAFEVIDKKLKIIRYYSEGNNSAVLPLRFEEKDEEARSFIVVPSAMEQKGFQLVQVYVDDIFLGPYKSWCDEFEALYAKADFIMSSWVNLHIFPRDQVAFDNGGGKLWMWMYIVPILVRFPSRQSHLNAVQEDLTLFLQGKQTNWAYDILGNHPLIWNCILDSDYGGSNLDRKSNKWLSILGQRLISWTMLIWVGDCSLGSNLTYALTANPTIYDSLVKQFWQSAITNTKTDGSLEISATIDTIRTRNMLLWLNPKPSSSTPQAPTPPFIPTPTPPPIPTPTPPPIPTPTSTPPILKTEPTPDVHIYEEQSPVHHHFSPSQE
ncbi:hypothetical protein Tco_0861676 [Tanacetum coccineum]|uniref:Uncharacterized protein n=1 Tax=Tanacetum coccineum TaxID=301880 RepID=A0ABQ5BP37_9ASTR